MASSLLLPAISAGPSRAAGSRAAGASAAAQKLFSVGAVKPAPCGSWRSAAGSRLPSRPHRLAAAASEEADVVAARPEGVAWDPDGLLPPPAGESHFARRARQKAEAMGVQLQQQGATRPIPAEHLAAGGLPAADGSLYDRPAFQSQLAERFLPVDLDTPGLRILHFDPPIFALPDFFTEEECDSAVAAAVESGTLVPSKVGGSNLKDLAAAAGNTRRTSSSVLLDAGVQASHPRLKAMAQSLQSKGQRLVGHGESTSSWGAPGKLPLPGQYCYESLQMARYEQGQHFLAHEDGFPPSLARQNGFQRHATLLIYLNTTTEGGATRFDLLNLAVQPQKGKAVLFFPALSDGTSDPRTLHTAEDAADTKWVTQQWIARGLSGAVVDPIAAALAGSLGLVKGSGSSGAAAAAGERQQLQQRRAQAEEGPSAAEALLAAGKKGSRGKKGGKKPAGKGFGSS